MASLEEAKLAKKLAKKRKHKEVQQASERVAAEEPAISKKQKRDKKKEAGSAASEAADPSAVLNRLSADIDNLDEGSNGQTLGLTDRLTVSTVPNKKKKKQKQDQRLQNGTKEVSTSQSMEDDQPLPKKLKTKKKRAQEAQLANGSPVLIDPQVRHSMLPSVAARSSEPLPESLPCQAGLSRQTIAGLSHAACPGYAPMHVLHYRAMTFVSACLLRRRSLAGGWWTSLLPRSWQSSGIVRAHRRACRCAKPCTGSMQRWPR